MDKMILGLQTAGLVFSVVCIGHLLRLVFRLKITIGNFTVPLWFSFFGVLFSGTLAVWMISLAR